MDIIMPVMGGYEATENIRKIEEEFKLSSNEKHFICGFSANNNLGNKL
jgi:CheY-like chemotaxis protein